MDAGKHLIATTAAELRAALPGGGVLLGLDLGTKTIGTALSDAGWRFATAGKTLPRGKFSRDRAALEAHAGILDPAGRDALWRRAERSGSRLVAMEARRFRAALETA